MTALVLGACGRDGASIPAPGRVELTEVAAGVLVPGVSDDAGAVAFTEDFADGFDGWRIATDPHLPLAVEDGLLAASTGDEDGRPFLTLTGRRGALYHVVPVEPLTCYELSGSVRARDVVPSAEPFFGATPWLAELSDYGAPDELFAGGLDPLIYVRHLFPTAAGLDGWQDRRVVFRTGPHTRSLAIACLLGLTEEVVSGSVDFGAIRLRRMPLREFWEHLSRRPLVEFAAAEHRLEGWRARRLLTASLGAEVRSSILCLPGDVVRLTTRVPSGKPVLETGVGPWPDGLVAGEGRRQEFVVRIDGREVLRLDQPATATLTEARWREVEIDLARWAGEDATLELAVEGDLPGVFGAPALRDASARPAGWNVLLISIDTLRADHVGCYGYDRNTTPRLDELASEGIRCSDVTSQAPYTLPAHASMLTGQFPSIHGVQTPPRMVSARRSPSLPRILSDRGYVTRAFTGGGFVNADFGFDRGFDAFSNIDTLRHRDAGFFRKLLAGRHSATNRMKRGGVIPFEVTRELIDEYGPERVQRWVREHADQAFFLFVHTYTVHDYDPPAEYRTCHAEGCTSDREDFSDVRMTRELGWTPQEIPEEDRQHLIHLYDEALRFTDHLVGDLLDVVDELGLRDRTIVVVTSDHGEEMFDRGLYQHGKTLYEELTSIPMLIRYPGVEPRVIDRPVMLVDLAPTILGLLGIPPDPRMQGVDLLNTQPAPRAMWSEIHDAFVHKYALRDPDGWKVLYGPPDDDVAFPNPKEWELYDLGSDAGERDDLAATRGDRLGRMQAELQARNAALQELGRSLGEIGVGELDDATLAQLRELGYVE